MPADGMVTGAASGSGSGPEAKVLGGAPNLGAALGQAAMSKQDLSALKAKLKQLAAPFSPAICKRGAPDVALFQEQGIRVAEWASLGGKPSSRAPGRQPGGAGAYAPRPKALVAKQPGGDSGLLGRGGPLPKLSRAVKSKANGSGRTYTSRYRGVHQTFPTRRWEAQFRRNGKPTSLGCFDHESEAAKAYDKMMLWCELHNTTGVKGGITNFDASEYEKDIPWLQSITQDELIETLRSEGRRQAAQRMMRNKRDGGAHGETQTEDTNTDGGSAAGDMDGDS